MNLQVKDLVTGDHHVLIMSDEPRVYAMGENTLYDCDLNEVVWNGLACSRWCSFCDLL